MISMTPLFCYKGGHNPCEGHRQSNLWLLLKADLVGSTIRSWALNVAWTLNFEKMSWIGRFSKDLGAKMAMWGFPDPYMVKFGQFWASPKLVLKWIACFALSSIKLIFHLKDHKNMMEQNSPGENFVIAHTLSLPFFDPFVISATPYQRYPNTPWKYHAQLALFAEILAQYLISPKHSFSSCALPFCSSRFTQSSALKGSFYLVQFITNLRNLISSWIGKSH